MSTIAVVVAVEGSAREPRAARPGRGLRCRGGSGRGRRGAGPGGVVSHLPAEVTVLVDRADTPSEAAALRAAVDYAERSGADALLGVARRGAGRGGAGADPASWRRIAEAPAGEYRRRHRGGRPAASSGWRRRCGRCSPSRAGSTGCSRLRPPASPTCPLDFPGGSPSPPPAESGAAGAADRGPGAGEASAADLARRDGVAGSPARGVSGWPCGMRAARRHREPAVARRRDADADTFWLVGRAERQPSAGSRPTVA